MSPQLRYHVMQSNMTKGATVADEAQGSQKPAQWAYTGRTKARVGDGEMGVRVGDIEYRLSCAACGGKW